MEKANVLKALETCNANTSCIGCPYHGITDCEGKMHDDVIALVKANENETPKYTRISIYTKRTNLVAYFDAKCISGIPSELYNRQSEYYTREREIQLIAMFRYEKGKTFCKIKCPINPLPVKGEFEVPSEAVVHRFLFNNGWSFKQKFYLSMFM